MARLPRLTVPHQPHHVIQRGNNRQAIFGDGADRQLLLQLLEENARKHQVAIHGYVLLDNQFHLLATPDSVEGIPQMMQAVGRRYVRNFNLRQARTGTLWEGRYRSNVIQAERFLLPCLVYLDLAAVREGLAGAPDTYTWSSHAHYVGLRSDRLVTPHPLHWELGNTPFAREEAYALLVQAGLAPEQERVLSDSALRGWALGDAAYMADLQRRTERRVAPGQAGRPRKLPALSVPD